MIPEMRSYTYSVPLAFTLTCLRVPNLRGITSGRETIWYTLANNKLCKKTLFIL